MRVAFLLASAAALAATVAVAQSPVHLPANSRTVTWGHYWAGDKPVLTIQPGQTVAVDTLLTNSPTGLARAGVADNQIEPALKEVFANVPRAERGPGGHILTGPIYIQGAEPGDTLAVHILKIEGRIPYAYNSFSATSGFLDVPGLRAMRIIPLDWKTMLAHFAPGIAIPMHPFFGSMGVAPPAADGKHSSTPPDLMGGNMDNKDLVAGSTVYFPVFTPGALFYVGDGHAGQGDGEVDITAIETSLRGTFRFELIKHTQQSWPRAETPTQYIAMGFSPDLHAATTQAINQMIEFLMVRRGLSRADAYMLVSVAGNVHDSELVDQSVGVHVLMPKSIFTAPPPATALDGTWEDAKGATFVFRGSNDNLSGTAVTGDSRREIRGGKLENGHITFETANPFSPDSPLQRFQGTLTPGTHGDATLTVGRTEYVAQTGYPYAVSAAWAHRPGPKLDLHKSSTETVYHLPADLAHTPLPPLRPLPPNGLALTPPMGWNSWNHFAEKVDDAAVRRTADLMVSTGLRDAGYVYVNIDDTWEGQRDAEGNIQSNAKFPDMKALADYVHSKGLKLGIYSSPGPKTCAGYAGSYGHEAQDARTYAAWGVDYLKYDWCSASLVYRADEMQQAYEKMALALRATGRPIVYSLCQYGDLDVWKWGAEVGGNLWRTTGDITDHYDAMARIGFGQSGHEAYAAPGHWNDPDMLEIGNGGMTTDEYKTHMSLWSLLAAPLLAGNDLTQMTPEIRDILINREVIAVDQDALGQQAHRLRRPATKDDAATEVWVRPLAGGAQAVGLFNRGDAPAPITIAWKDLGLPANPRVRDLWAHRDLSAPDAYTATVPAHGVVLLRVQ